MLDVKDLLEQALAEVCAGSDATATIELALDTHRVVWGELGPEEIAMDEPQCICSSDLRAQGGYTSGCLSNDHGRDEEII